MLFQAANTSGTAIFRGQTARAIFTSIINGTAVVPGRRRRRRCRVTNGPAESVIRESHRPRRSSDSVGGDGRWVGGGKGEKKKHKKKITTYIYI